MATKKEIDKFFEDYGEGVMDFPEFDYEKVLKKYGRLIEANEDIGDSYNVEATFMFDTKVAMKYTMLVYHPESPFNNINDWTLKKEAVVEVAGVPAAQRDKLFSNENPMIGDMATRILRETSDFEYELLVSARDAIATLLEVVRKPINSSLLDDKERNAVKAKRECYDDARYMMLEVRIMYSKAREESPDVADHINTSVFRGGLAESMADKKRKT